MALTPSIRVSQAGVYLVTPTAETPALHVSMGAVVVVGNFPAESIELSQAGAIVTGNFVSTKLRVSQAGVMVVAKGRVDNPKVRAWTFTLDGHDFYVLRLGDDFTFVYDVYSEQWMDWSSLGMPYWRVNCGINWVGGQALAALYGSDVLVGDDTHGVLYFLNPEQPYDQTPIEDAPIQERYFERVVMGQVPMRGREVLPCYTVWLTTDMGRPAYDGAGVTLLTSDDAGESFDDHGLVTVTPGVYSPELSWYSLGQIGAPGRLFKIVDDGAIARIDGMEMNDPDDDR